MNEGGTVAHLHLIRLSDIPLGPKEIQDWYGVWHYNRRNLTLELWGTGSGYPRSAPYWIDLEKIHDSAHMLDWIFQINHKTWGTPRVMKDLLDAFGHIFDPQCSLCSCGKDKSLNRDFMKKRRKHPEKYV